MIALALLLVSANQELLPNPSLEDGATVPAGWTLEGGGAVEDEGRTGRCVMVEGTGDDSGQWSAQLSLAPGSAYRVSFWARGEGGGGCIISGPAAINRDFTPSTSWTRYSFVFRTPIAGPQLSDVRFGQWHWKGRIWFDDVSLIPVEPADVSDAVLSYGERVAGTQYTYAPQFGWEGSTCLRQLVGQNASFNSDRFILSTGTSLVFEHKAPVGAFVSASVVVNTQAYVRGTLRVSVSADGDIWTQIGEQSSDGRLAVPVPAGLFPAERLLIRLEPVGETYLQVGGYRFEGKLDQDLGHRFGRTAFIEVAERSPGLGVKLLRLDPDTAAVELTTGDVPYDNATVSAQIGTEEPAVSNRLSLPPRDTQRVSLTLRPAVSGLQPVRITVGQAGKMLYAAETTLAIPVTALAGYGETIASGQTATVWWCDATRKVGTNTPAPEAVSKAGVRIEGARGEFEPFQIVLAPREDLKRVGVRAQPLKGPGAAEIAADNVSIERVEYVPITMPTDETGVEGDWPDPLPPYDGTFPAPADRNAPLWVRVRIPRDAAPGEYVGAVSLSLWSPLDAVEHVTVPVHLRVRDFEIPAKQRLTATFGISPYEIWRYHNVWDREDQERVWDLYLRNFAEHRIAVYDPMALDPLDVSLVGGEWDGLQRDTGNPHSGKLCAKIVDDDDKSAKAIQTTGRIAVDRARPLRVAWSVRSAAINQAYQVTLNTYDAAGNWISGHNVDRTFAAGPDWTQQEFVVAPDTLAESAAAVVLVFRPAPWTEVGENKGTAWFDDVFLGVPGGENMLSGPGFEETGLPKVTFDFTRWDAAGERYLDGLGFKSFSLPIRWMGSGTFYSRSPGEVAGYRQGSPEYDEIMGAYLKGLENHLREKGWLDRAYVYWFDEPEPKDYDFVRDGMELIHRLAPGLRRMLTEQPEDALGGAVDIWCPCTPEFHREAAARRQAAGEHVWWYICTGPKAPYCTLFIDHSATDLRVWLWQTFASNVEGVLVWQSNYWTSGAKYPGDKQNPWEDPMSWVSGYNFGPGDELPWGNGDGRFIYPPNRDAGDTTTKYIRGPVNSIRWEMLREGIEDWEYLRTLQDLVDEGARRGLPAADLDRARELLTVPASVFSSMTQYTVDPAPIYERRSAVADEIERLSAALR